VPTGKSPMLAAEALKAYGFRVAIYPVAGLTAACAAMQEAYRYLLEHGSLIGSSQPAMPMPQMHELAGFPDVWAFEKRHAEV
jgi:2,3-dimethylmalate lyase